MTFISTLPCIELYAQGGLLRPLAVIFRCSVVGQVKMFIVGIGDWLGSALCILVPVWNCRHYLIKTRIGSRKSWYSQWSRIVFIAFKNRN
jgi:hypothetical protein